MALFSFGKLYYFPLWKGSLGLGEEGLEGRTGYEGSKCREQKANKDSIIKELVSILRNMYLVSNIQS